MSSEFTLEGLLDEVGNSPSFVLEELLLDVNETICRRMEELNVSRSQLAERLDVDRAYVTNETAHH